MKKKVFILLSILVLSAKCFAQKINLFTYEKPELTASAALSFAPKRDMGTPLVGLESTFSADFKELYLKTGFAFQNSRFDFAGSFNYMPTFFNRFRIGIGFTHHFYRYYGSFLENDLLCSLRFKWFVTESLSMDFAGGVMCKFAVIDSIVDYTTAIANYCFSWESNVNWDITSKFNFYAGITSMDFFSYPLFGTPYLKTGLCYHLNEAWGLDASITLKFIDMIVSTACLDACIFRTGAKVYF